MSWMEKIKCDHCERETTQLGKWAAISSGFHEFEYKKCDGQKRQSKRLDFCCCECLTAFFGFNKGDAV